MIDRATELFERVNGHLDRSHALQKQMTLLMMNQNVELRVAQRELIRLRSLEKHIRELAETDPAVARLLEQAGKE